MYRIGTSGYNYDEWKGSFYPEKMPSAKMLPYYAERFSTVEINYTFYRMPSEKTIEGWVEATPERLPVHPQGVAPDHPPRQAQGMRGAGTDVLVRAGSRAGRKTRHRPLPASALLQEGRRDPGRLPGPGAPRTSARPSSSGAGPGSPTTCTRLLRERGAALCVKDDEKFSTPVEITAGHAYFRLRDEGYTEEGIAEWAATIRDSTRGLDDVFIYFKHEDKGIGPAFARMMTAALEAQ